jgi:DNA-binding winged helix-turn-helix (wHTH) protein
MAAPQIYRFDDFTLEPAAMRLSRGGEELALEPKSFRLLQFLIEHRDRVLGKEEIFRVVWQETAVSDNALTRAIAQIRKALDDDPKHPRYIDTVPTVGYRFIGVLTAAEPPPVTPFARKSSKTPVWVAIAAAVVVAAGLGAWRLWPKTPGSPMLFPIPLTTYRGSEDMPSFSPDGTQIAFQWNGEKQDNMDIYVKALGPDATPLRLTTEPAPDKAPAWSPDGSTIAFQRIIAPGKADLMLIPALGGPERKLAEFSVSING